MAQQFKPLLAALAAHIIVSVPVLAALFPIWLPPKAPGKAAEDAQMLQHVPLI